MCREIGKDEVQRMTTGNICVKRYKEVKIILESYGIPGNFRFSSFYYICAFMQWVGSYEMKIIRSNRLNLFRKKHGGVFMKKLKI